MKRLENQVALVTGAGRGIGKEVALQLAAEGAKVIVNDLDAAPAEETVAEIKQNGGEAIVCAGSITEKGFAVRFIGAAVENYGDIHIIVNCAGYTWDSVIQKMTEHQFDAMMEVHVKAPWRILKAACEVFREKSKEEAARGEEVVRKVVNVSSISGTRGNAGQSNYSTAKAALTGLTRTLAKEWGRYKVTVNCIAFGLVETRLTEATDEKKTIIIEGNEVPVGVPVANIQGLKYAVPMGRGATPKEGGGSVVMLCFPEANYVSGQVIEVTGGF